MNKECVNVCFHNFYKNISPVKLLVLDIASIRYLNDFPLLLFSFCICKLINM